MPRGGKARDFPSSRRVPREGQGGKAGRVRCGALTKVGAAKRQARASAGFAAAQTSGEVRQSPPLPAGSPACRSSARFTRPAGKRPHAVWIAPARSSAAPGPAEPAGAAPPLPTPGAPGRGARSGQDLPGEFSGTSGAQSRGVSAEQGGQGGRQGMSDPAISASLPRFPVPSRRLSAGQ